MITSFWTCEKCQVSPGPEMSEALARRYAAARSGFTLAFKTDAVREIVF